MTRSAQTTHADTRNRKARAPARSQAKPSGMKFLVFEDNDHGYHWAIVAGSGETLVHSASFASPEDAKQAARTVHAGAASASFEPLAGDTPVDLRPLRKTRETRVARHDRDAERWLDEGGSFSSEAVTRCPARR